MRCFAGEGLAGNAAATVALPEALRIGRSRVPNADAVRSPNRSVTADPLTTGRTNHRNGVVAGPSNARPVAVPPHANNALNKPAKRASAPSESPSHGGAGRGLRAAVATACPTASRDCGPMRISCSARGRHNDVGAWADKVGTGWSGP